MNDLNRQIAELLGWKLWAHFDSPSVKAGMMPRVVLMKDAINPWYDREDEAAEWQDVTAGHHSVLDYSGIKFNPDTDANQIDAAVREWCGDDYRKSLYTGFLARFTNTLFALATATPEQKCRALIAAKALNP